MTNDNFPMAQVPEESVHFPQMGDDRLGTLPSSDAALVARLRAVGRADVVLGEPGEPLGGVAVSKGGE